MTLTEQWNKGELESGYYFFKTKDDIKIGFLYKKLKYPYDRRHNTIDDVDEALAPVPSYKEYQQLRKFLEEFNALDVAKENQQLKELLLECQQSFRGIRVQIEEFEYSMARKTAQIAIDEIDNAIGEK